MMCYYLNVQFQGQRVKETWNSLNSFSKNNQISNVLKIRPVRAESFRLDGQTDMKKLTVAFRSFLNSPMQGTN